MEWLGPLVFLLICLGVGLSFRRPKPVAHESPGAPAEPDEADAPASVTPEDFRRDTLPLVVEAWQRHCFCRNAGFQRMTALDLGPNALADAQILIHDIIEQRFSSDGPWAGASGERARTFHCPQCNAKCVVVSEDFSINMHRSYVRWSTPHSVGAKSPYLIGFYGFSPPNHLDGFQRVRSPTEFLSELTRSA
jgi:hypothetical protein